MSNEKRRKEQEHYQTPAEIGRDKEQRGRKGGQDEQRHQGDHKHNKQ